MINLDDLIKSSSRDRPDDELQKIRQSLSDMTREHNEAMIPIVESLIAPKRVHSFVVKMVSRLKRFQ